MQFDTAQTRFHIQRFVDLRWDALGQVLLLWCELGPADGAPTGQILFSVDPVAAAALHDVLPQAFADRPAATAPRQ